MADEVLHIIPLDQVAERSAIWDLMNPMMTGFIKSMIRHGSFIVTDKNGKRVPAEQALELIP